MFNMDQEISPNRVDFLGLKQARSLRKERAHVSPKATRLWKKGDTLAWTRCDKKAHRFLKNGHVGLIPLERVYQSPCRNLRRECRKMETDQTGFSFPDLFKLGATAASILLLTSSGRRQMV